ncbi:hypothetical protein DFH08DRAFT_1076457 [Mycena albidolilacea]|uniref:Uncharacterized protein n=1 Tax=Mycena albidolilacea TaxID=1033008 RepID=A0AAD7EYV4_9AGAR|nr:hypothetical protein DFH08DRAFT_1076457 [Mycena albidolilacea]
MAPVSTSFSAYLVPAVFSTDAVYANAAFAMTDDAKPSPLPSLVHYIPKFDGGEEAKHSDRLRSLTPCPPQPLGSSLVEQYALSQLPTPGGPPSR